MTIRRTRLSDAMVRATKPRTREYSLRDAICPALSLRVQPNGSRSWVVRKQVHGKTQRIGLGAASYLSVDEARAKAFACLSDPKAKPTMRPAPLFRDLARQFLEAKRKSYKPSTLNAFEAYLNSQLIPTFGDTPTNRITTPEVATWFHGYSETHPGGANQAILHLVTLLNWAKVQGLMPKGTPNPCAPIKRNRRQPRGQMLTSAQLKRLGHVLDRRRSRTPDAVDAIRLLLLTGCRAGEIVGLTWGEVKPDRLCLTDAKTGPREVMCSEPVQALLDERRKTSSGSRVFPYPGTTKSAVGRLRDHWHTIRSLAKLPETLRLHDLRHTYASHAILKGETVAMTGELLGHSRPRSTERYAHLSDRHLSWAANQMANAIGKLIDA